MAIPAEHYRFSVADYHKMAEFGVLTEDSRVELIEGEILQMSPIGHRHAVGVMRVSRRFGEDVGRAAIVWVQNPIRLGDYGEPQPDVALLRPQADDYASRLPAAADVLLVVEIADTSFDYDRQTKAPLYARNGIPEYWLADLNQRRVLIYTDPTPDGYASVRVAQVGETISPLAFPQVAVPASEIVG